LRVFDFVDFFSNFRNRRKKKIVMERLVEVEEQVQAMRTWIAEKLRPGIQGLKEAMRTQVSALREELEAERQQRQHLEAKLSSISQLIEQQVSAQLKPLQQQLAQQQRAIEQLQKQPAPQQQNTFPQQQRKQQNTFQQQQQKPRQQQNVRQQQQQGNAFQRKQKDLFSERKDDLFASNSAHSNDGDFNLVKQKLDDEGLGRYADAFKMHGIVSLDRLSQVTNAEFVRFGVKLPAHKRLLRAIIDGLKASGAGGNTSSSPSISSSAPADLFEEPTSAPVRQRQPIARQPTPEPLFDEPVAAAPMRQRPASSYVSRQRARRQSGGGDDDESIESVVARVRDDKSDTDWVLFFYDKASGQALYDSSGSGGYDDMVEHISPSKVQYGLLRLLQGDRESRRVKFVFVRWVGPSVPTMVKARSNTLKSDVSRRIGQFHVEVFAEDEQELTRGRIERKLKAAAGADYDQGNRGGYETQASSLKARALELYGRKEREGNLKGVVFETHALPSSTPCDLTGRPMVAPPSEAHANIDMQGHLDVNKWRQ
jgi:Cofilin/tropomyosin-type actin-binding protein/SAM domain (Sterile alpha motif)